MRKHRVLCAMIVSLGCGAAHSVVVSSTLNAVAILGNTYDVTFWQDPDAATLGSGGTTFNDVFGAGSPLLTFNAGNAAAAAAALLSATNAAGFDITPGNNQPNAEVFALPFAYDAADVSYYTGWANTPANSFTGVLGPFDVGRAFQVRFVSWVTFASAVPEPSTWVLVGLGLLGVVAKSGRRRSA